MFVDLKRISSYFFLALLGAYALNKILLFAGMQSLLMLSLDRALILPLGVMTLIYLFASIKVHLEKKKEESPIYVIILALFFTATLLLLLFVSLFIKTAVV